MAVTGPRSLGTAVRDAGFRSPPQHRTLLSDARIAQVWALPAATALAGPRSDGTADSLKLLLPQQTTLLSERRIAHVCVSPADTALAPVTGPEAITTGAGADVEASWSALPPYSAISG